jgi:plasmid replication initiation protein
MFVFWHNRIQQEGVLFLFPEEQVEPNLNNLVTKSNVLIEANYKLGVIEQKIILSIASNIQPTDSDFKTYTLRVKEFNELLGLKGTPKYTELRKITKDLMQKVFEIRIGKKIIQVAWLSFVAYNESEGTIDIRFDPFLRPYFLQLKNEFTSYKLENIVKLKSSYAIRIYELLKQYEKMKERTFSLKDLRRALGAEKVYPAYGNFKQRVLVAAQMELRYKTDISFEIEEIKEKRRVEKIKFIINAKKLQVEVNLSQANSSFQKASKLALKAGFRLREAQYKKWLTYGEENLLRILGETKAKKNIQNPIGYITYRLKKLTKNDPKVNDFLNEQDILVHLISNFKKSKEQLPNWFLKEEAIKDIKNYLEVSETKANEIFNGLQKELYESLGLSFSEIEQDSIDSEKLERLKELQKAYQKRTV